jgi:hypothetical protein
VTITEPMTMLTDYLAAALGAWWSARLFRAARHASTRVWAAGFAAFAVGAFVGGTYHGFSESMGPRVAAWAWKLTLAALGSGNLLFVAAVIAAHARAPAAKALHATNAIMLFAYACVVSGRDEFLFVALHTGFAMLALIGIEAWAWLRGRARAAPWILAAVGLTALGVGVQQSGFALSAHFDHNDLYHLIQIAGLYLFFRGGLLFPD